MIVQNVDWRRTGIIAFFSSLAPLLALGWYGHRQFTRPLPVADPPAPSEIAVPAAAPSPVEPVVARTIAPSQGARPPDMLSRARTLAIAETSSFETEADVDRYLDQLEARARQKKAVTALEIEPGIMAISDLADRIGLPAAAAKRGKFTFRMSQLSLELEGRSGREDKVDLRALGEQIRTTHEPEARRTLVAQYAEAVSQLPDDDRTAELPRLRELSIESD